MSGTSLPVSLLPDSAHLEVLLAEEPRLRSLARALVDDPATADEAVQETLEQGSEGLRQQGRLRGYLGRALGPACGGASNSSAGLSTLATTAIGAPGPRASCPGPWEGSRQPPP